MDDFWFAWHPVKTKDGRWVWLRNVHRYLRGNASRCSETHRTWWEYWI